jgi:hypothetical protein
MLCFVIITVMGFVVGDVPIEMDFCEDRVITIFMALQFCDSDVEYAEYKIA